MRCLLLLVGLVLSHPVLCWSAERPNVVLITADNLGYGDLPAYGNDEIRAPHLDQLAQEGVRCAAFYTASPTCTVSRASLLTGRTPQRHGLNVQLPGIGGNYGIGLSHSEILLPQLLREQGYRTACFGKWNIGFAPGSRPTDRGFDEFFGHASGNIDYYTHVYGGRLDMHRGTEPVKVAGYSTDLFAAEACRFIREHVDDPFFIYLPFNAPHFPNAKNKQHGEDAVWQAPDDAFAVYGYDPQTTDARQRYRAVVTALDAAIGRVLNQLADSGLEKRTLVMFMSDNGAFMLPGRGLEVASNAPLREGGVTLWEGGIRVPALVKWPGVIPAGTVCDEPLWSCDFFSLTLRAAGAEPPADRTIDGRDPLPTLAGTAPSPHETLCWQFGEFSAIRRGKYKLLRTAPDTAWMLFDLENDLDESQDLAAAQPARVREWSRTFAQWLEMTAKGRAIR